MHSSSVYIIKYIATLVLDSRDQQVVLLLA